tara:strand:- start:2317 stop:2499 length:183 start_codon:yes stop_codon:yes gene_type:complete
MITFTITPELRIEILEAINTFASLIIKELSLPEHLQNAERVTLYSAKIVEFNNALKNGQI